MNTTGMTPWLTARRLLPLHDEDRWMNRLVRVVGESMAPPIARPTCCSHSRPDGLGCVRGEEMWSC